MLILGEVQTAALMNSAELSSAVAEQALALVRGERVQVSERPNDYTVSPDVHTGVDCRVAARNGTSVRVVGTLAGRVTLTGGRVLQGSVATRLDPGAENRREWMHYLSRLGVVETIGTADAASIAERHLRCGGSASTMGMGSFAARLLSQVQESELLDHRPPFVARRTTLRWAAETSDAAERHQVRLTIEENGLRTLWLVLKGVALADIITLCEDAALHDWLLTTLLGMVKRSRIGVGEPAEVVARLRPAVDHLLHLWLPGARLGRVGRDVWRGIEQRPGFSRQWETLVRRVRDQVVMSVALLNVPGPRPV